MIDIKKGIEDFKELENIVKEVNNIDVLVELFYNDITNDLRDRKGLIDLNYKSICATIKKIKII